MRQYFHYFLAEQSTRFCNKKRQKHLVLAGSWQANKALLSDLSESVSCVTPQQVQLYIPVLIYYFLNQSIMASPSSSEFSHIIDWTEAMEQCGDDEEFLHELLSDLRGEIDAQIVKIDEVLNVSVR